MKEPDQKIGLLRAMLEQERAGAIRLRGIDWFAWATSGGSNAVLLAAETGVAEVLVTADEAWVLTDAIEAQRLRDEELSGAYRMHISAWNDPDDRPSFVKRTARGKPVLSDRPQGEEGPLPDSLRRRRYVLNEAERERYRDVGRLTAEAMSEVLYAARSEWTEQRLAGAGAQALWARGLHPALTLAAGARRLPIYRHPTPRAEPLGDSAMLVFCARGHGLYANLTRFVYFRSIDAAQRQAHDDVRLIEAEALAVCKPGRTLIDVYDALAQAYEKSGHPDALRQHHQGGLTGYLSREIVMTHRTDVGLEAGMALALNPSIIGAKVEDTFLLGEEGELENLTLDDARWPTERIESRLRPLPLVRA